MVEIRKLGNSNIRIFSHVPSIIGNHNVVHSRLNVVQNFCTIFKNCLKIYRFYIICVGVTSPLKILVDDESCSKMRESFKIYLTCMAKSRHNRIKFRTKFCQRGGGVIITKFLLSSNRAHL